MFKHNPVTFLLVMLLLLIICFLASNTRAQSIINPEVTIPQGSLQGGVWTTSRGRNVSAFWGIPYAQPPIGNLRFANPLPAGNWSGIRNASVGEIRCPQLNSNVLMGQEDCLYLDVYTPQLPENSNASLFPVMVNVHGGALDKESSWTTQNPHFLLNEDVVLVVANYRLGPLGFLSTGDEVASGNWGLKDQILALEWIQSNIKYFGGDPNQVTIFGISAGSTVVHLLTLIDATDGLFHKYITQSGSALAQWAYQPKAQYAELAFELGEYVGCSNDSSNSLIDCLRTVDALEIIATYPRFLGWHTYLRHAWGPTDEPDIKGAVLTESAANLFAAGKIRDLPWITGVVRDEGLMYTIELDKVYNLFIESNKVPSKVCPFVRAILQNHYTNFYLHHLLIYVLRKVQIYEIYKSMTKGSQAVTILGQKSEVEIGQKFNFDEELFQNFLDNFDSVLPIILSRTYMFDSGAALVSAVKSFYLDNDLTANASVLIPRLTLLFGDALFNYPTYSALQQHSAIARNPQYFYNFHYRGALSLTILSTNSMDNFGVTHGDDSIYVFSRTNRFVDYGINMTETDLEMSDIMAQLWTSFAINGTPTSPALDDSIRWDPYSSKDNYLRIGNGSDLELDLQYSFYVERMKFWADLEAALSSSVSASASSALKYSGILLLTLLLLNSELTSVAKI